MQITDPIADLLTRIRNASTAKHPSVDVPASKLKKAIADILLEEGYVKGVQVIEDDKQGVIRITLKYTETARPSSPASAACLSPACASTPTASSCRRS